MKVSKLITELLKYPPDANARAYEGEVNGIIIEEEKPGGKELGVIFAHESEPPSEDSAQSREGPAK